MKNIERKFRNAEEMIGVYCREAGEKNGVNGEPVMYIGNFAMWLMEEAPKEAQAEESGIVRYARSELKRLEDACENDDARELQKMVSDGIIDLIKVFGEQGHSGFSAGYAINCFKRVANWMPLSPLTGEDDEWVNVSFSTRDGTTTDQNKRYSGLFRENHDNSTAHDINDMVFSDNGGITWFSSGHFSKLYRKPIQFPYMPPSEPRRIYIQYTEDVPIGETGDKFIDITNDKEAIEKLREKYEGFFAKAREE